MTNKVADRVEETSVTTGTGTYALAGATAGNRAFSAAFSNADDGVEYCATDGINWEVGYGTYNANTLTRDTIRASSNAHNAVNWSGNTKTIFSNIPAAVLALLFTALQPSDPTLTRPVIGPTTWAGRPDATSYAGAIVRISDIGLAGIGSLWISDGTRWYPLNGQVFLAMVAVPVTAPANTSENVLATINVPGGSMGISGGLSILASFSFTNNGNSKTLRIRFGGAAGTIYTTIDPTGSLISVRQANIYNRGAANSQVGLNSVAGASTTALVTSAVDTLQDTTAVITAQKASAGDTFVLERYYTFLHTP